MASSTAGMKTSRSAAPPTIHAISRPSVTPRSANPFTANQSNAMSCALRITEPSRKGSTMPAMTITNGLTMTRLRCDGAGSSMMR
jgi:hypothetical protein